MNYYPHHIGDYRRDTSHLSLLEHGVYRQLLDTYYLSEQPIPKETEVVFRRLSAKTEEERKAVEIVLSEFFVLTEAGWIQTRCDEEIREYQGKAGRARDNGKLGGRPKKTKEVISRLSEETDEKANHEPRTINQEPLKPKSKDLARGTRLPKDWFLPKEWGEWALKENSALTPELIRKIAEQFKDYWIAVSGHKGVKLDWCATWRNWIRKSGGLPQARPEKFDGLAYVMQFAKKVGERDEKVIEH